MSGTHILLEGVDPEEIDEATLDGIFDVLAAQGIDVDGISILRPNGYDSSV